MPKLGKDYKKVQKTLSFMKWLKGKLASENVTQQELAEQLGIKQQDVSYHINKHVPFNYAQLVIIFDYLNVSGSELEKLF